VRIYTKTGDKGDTALFDGTRVSKHDPRVSAYGEVDELNAWLGLARAQAPRVEKASVTSDDVTRLERAIDRFEADLPPLRRFILAGGCPAGAFLHLARAVCRRAERGIVSLGREAVPSVVVVYVNRLSDLLFVLARAANRQAGVTETEW